MATSRNFEEFARRLEIIADRVEGNSLKTIKRAALAADQAAVQLTPVNTGRAKVNWQVSIGAPAEGTLESPGPGAAENVALSQGRSVISKYKLGQGGIFITNNLPYIILLDDGYSVQRPEGMTAGAVQAALSHFRNARLL